MELVGALVGGRVGLELLEREQGAGEHEATRRRRRHGFELEAAIADRQRLAHDGALRSVVGDADVAQGGFREALCGFSRVKGRFVERGDAREGGK